MALKSQRLDRPWVARKAGIIHQGTGLVTSDELITSVSISPGGENPFLSQHKTLIGSTGFNTPGSMSTSVFLQSGPSSFGNTSYLNIPAVAWTSANLWARSHPLRPAVRLPVFWLELKDIPDMIRQAGRFLLHAKKWRTYVRRSSQSRDLATANLAFQFGWAPLISDLYKLARFQDEVDKRRKRLDKGTRAGVFRTSFQLGINSASGSGSGFANFGSFTNFATPFRYSGNSKSWAVMKWAPTLGGGGLPSKDDDLRPYLLGLHPSQMLSNVWEALPWSWLVDYFANIGDLVEGLNRHDMSPAGGSVMTKTDVTFTHAQVNGLAVSLRPGSLRMWKHGRAPASSSSAPKLSVPTLGAGQLSILGSLATIRGRRLGSD